MFNYEKFNLCKQSSSPAITRVVEFTPPGVEIDNIAKVLSLSVDGKITAVTAQDGYVDAEGRVNFRLMFMTADGMPKGVDYNADFTVKIECECNPGDTVSALVDIVESDVSADGQLKLSAVIEVKAAILSSLEIEALADAEMCFKTMRGADLPAFKAAKSISTTVADEINAIGDVESVLLLDSRVIIKKCVAEENTARIEGEVYAAVTYAGDGMMITKQLIMPIVEEVEVEGITADDIITAEATVKSARIVLTGVTGDNVIRFEGEISIKLQVMSMVTAAVIDDMFMLTNEITLSRTDVEYRRYTGAKCFTERISGIAELSENRPAARDICAIPYCRCYISKSEVSADGLTIEGIANTDVIYTDENGFNSVRAEVPFSILIPGEFAPIAETTAVVCEMSARVKHDREMEVDLTLVIRVCEFEPCALNYIDAVEVGEAKEQNTSGLSLYLASDGDEMWDVCKALTATPEAILEQNPTLTMPLSAGDKVVYFRCDCAV